MARTDAARQVELLCRGTSLVVSPVELEERIARAAREDRPLRIKYGADPSAPDIHLGHTVPLRKMRQFQELGHEVYFVIGDFTARIGDPSGESETRPQLTGEQAAANARTYAEQIFRILRPERTKVVFNSEWLLPLTFADLVRLASGYTVARLLERDDFGQRLRDGRSICLHEFLYPLAQAYDSVALRADLELGGTDQTFNFVMTRDIMRHYGLSPQVVMTLPLLEGTDGVEKMSKSLGNYIGIAEPPQEVFGKTMSLPDPLIVRYFELATDVPPEDIRQMAEAMQAGTLNPRDAKLRLAGELTATYHGAEEAGRARAEWQRVFQEHQDPDRVPEVTVSAAEAEAGRFWIVRLAVLAGLCGTNAEARRLIRQGGLRVAGKRIGDESERLVLPEAGLLLQAGPRRFVRVRPEGE